MMREGIPFQILVILAVLILLLTPVKASPTGDEKIEQNPPGEKPDVTITDVTFSKNEPDEGDLITISVTIMNNESTEFEDLNIRLMRYEENITDRDISIKAENEATFDFEWKAEGGNQVITAILSINTPGSDGRVPLDNMSEEIDVELSPIGDVYTPILALVFIFIVVFGSVLIPSVVSAMTNKSGLKEKE